MSNWTGTKENEKLNKIASFASFSDVLDILAKHESHGEGKTERETRHNDCNLCTSVRKSVLTKCSVQENREK